MRVSVVVPVYNAMASLPELVSGISGVLAGRCDEFEVVLVNDASTDGSWQVIRELSSQDSRVRGINLMRNYGQHNALLCGIRAARYEITVTMDDDLQNPPSEIPKLLSTLAEGFDVVYGYPMRQQHGIWRDLASVTTKWVLKNAMGAATAACISAFRAFRTELREAFSTYRNRYVSIDVLLTYGTTRFAAVQVRHDVRAHGRSNYTLAKLVTHAFNLITGFSTMPLKLASWNGFICMGLGILALLFVLGRYLIQGGSVPGFPFLASLIVILSGAQLLALGVIGEYLSRMYAFTIDRPPYTVREFTEPAHMAVSLGRGDVSSPSTGVGHEL